MGEELSSALMARTEEETPTRRNPSLMRGVRDAQMASKHSSEEAYFSDPEELKDHEENLPRGRRSKSVDFSGIVEYAEVPRYKRASKCKLHKMSGLEKVAIRMELNEYKLKEMRVHSASRKNTLFYQVGNRTVFEGHE